MKAWIGFRKLGFRGSEGSFHDIALSTIMAS